MPTPDRRPAELSREIRSALDNLRPDYRAVFVLFHEHGQAYEEIAEAVGRPVGTVKYPHVKMFRLSDLDAQRLEALTKLWNCTEAAVIRRLLGDSARRRSGFGAFQFGFLCCALARAKRSTVEEASGLR